MNSEELQAAFSASAGGLSLITAAYLNIQALKHTGWLPARCVPWVVLLLSGVLAGAYFWSKPAFFFISLWLMIAGLLLQAHGGHKQAAAERSDSGASGR